MNLAKLLNRDANNLDAFRVVAACMVIYGHAYSLSPETGHSDFIFTWLGFDYSGSLAVKMFFFLSGLVVTNSLLEKRCLVQFAIYRFFRIFPALFVTVVLSAILLGPLLTTLPIDAYFSDTRTYRYISMNIIMKTTFMLPGVFMENPYQVTVNGSLWTIPYEIYAYIAIACLFMLGIFRSKLLPPLLFFIILIDPLTGNKLLLRWLSNPETFLLAPCFAFGAILALYKERIKINLFMLLVAWLLFFILRGATYNFYFFYLALFGTMLYVSGMDFLVRIKTNADLSYGMYLWGFPIQQILAHYFLDYGLRFNQIAAIGLCSLLGLLSWHLIEKQFIAVGRALGQSYRINTC